VVFTIESEGNVSNLVATSVLFTAAKSRGRVRQLHLLSPPYRASMDMYGDTVQEGERPWTQTYMLKSRTYAK